MICETSEQSFSVNDKNGFGALHYAIANEHFECVKVLVEKGANLNYPGRKRVNCIHIAAKSGNLEIV